MHDIRAIRENPDQYDRAWKRKGLPAQTPAILEIDRALRAAITEKQEAEAARNAASKQIGQAKAKKLEEEAQSLMGEVARLKDVIEEAAAREADLSKRMQDIVAALPNLPADDVPDGADEEGNVQRHVWSATGAAPSLRNDVQDHVALGEGLGMMDFEAAVRMSGSRFVVLKSDLARLERALASLMLDTHTQENGYTEVAPPLLVKDNVMFGTGQLPKFVDDQFTAARTLSREELLYQALEKFDEEFEKRGDTKPTALLKEMLEGAPTREDFWLIPTAEVSLTNLVREQIVDETMLPLRMTADTPCFRAEAGAAGRDTRGMIRLHQFRKVEMVSITTPEQSEAEHERMTACAEGILKKLDLPFRRMLLCAGDMGFSAKKTFDLEVWLPSQNKYREISSCSNCGDFQARRMNARYRSKDGVRFVHTLNGSGLAVGRTLVAILENYQNQDGSITVPAALRPYLGGQQRIAKA